MITHINISKAENGFKLDVAVREEDKYLHKTYVFEKQSKLNKALKAALSDLGLDNIDDVPF